MSDRELLEAAARAAGITDVWWDDAGYGWPDPSLHWNPLTDDGDALRLAVKLNLTINPYKEGVFVSRYEGEEVVAEPFAEMGQADCAATCRAIVRAAAAVAPK